MPASPPRATPRAAATFQGDDSKHVRSTTRSKRASHANHQEWAFSFPPPWPYTDMGRPVQSPVLGREIRCIFLARSPFPHRQSLATLGPCIPQGACRLRGTGTSHYPRAHNPIYGHWRTVDLTSIDFLCPVRFVGICNRSPFSSNLRSGPSEGRLTQKNVSEGRLTQRLYRL